MRIIVLGCFILTAVLSADTLYLRDGRTVRGTFLSGSSQSIRFLPDGGRAQVYPLTRVESVAFGDSTASSRSSSSDWRSDRSNNSNDRYRDNRDNRDNYNRDNYNRDSATRGRSASDVIPSGTQISVRMIDSIDSNETDVGRRYRASLDQDLVADGRVIARKGADATVEVVRVQQGRAIAGKEQVALALTEIMADGRRLTPVTQNAEVSSQSRGSQNVKVIGGTAALGAIIGAIAGGGSGAAIGAASGAALGTGVQAVRGQRIEVPSETELLFTLAEPMRI